jgi:hypothetical protein
MEEVKCPKCGEEDNLHANYDYNLVNTPIIEYLCNQCGEFFIIKKSEEDE